MGVSAANPPSSDEPSTETEPYMVTYRINAGPYVKDVLPTCDGCVEITHVFDLPLEPDGTIGSRFRKVMHALHKLYPHPVEGEKFQFTIQFMMLDN